MEDTQANGYISEKLFNGVMGNTVPVYHGAPDVNQYVNAKRFVFCNVSQDVVKAMNSNYNRRHRKWIGPAFHSTTHPSNKRLLAWATELLREELAPCVERVIKLDHDDDAYNKMLATPFLRPEISRALVF